MTVIDITDQGPSNELRWTEIDAWHLIGETTLSENGLWWVTTRCGIHQEWNQTYLDRLPGGSEKSCENCLILLAGDVDEPADDDDTDDETPAPKRRGRPPKNG